MLISGFSTDDSAVARAELRSALKDVLYDEVEQIPHRLDELETKDRLELLVKLMPYVFPKVQPVSQSLDEPIGW